MPTENANPQAQHSNSRMGAAVLVVAVALALAAVGYRAWSEDDQSDMVATQPNAPVTLDNLRERAQSSSDDAQPWQELGFAYFQRSEFADAAGAYRRAVGIDDSEAVLWSALGEALVMASERDPMPTEALAAFRKASELDMRDPRARYFLAVNRDLGGDHEGAISDWLALLADTPQGAPWESDLVRTIEQVGAINSIEVAPRIDLALAQRPTAPVMTSTGLSGPSASDIAAAGRLPPGEQREMAEGMVERLEQRLAGDPQNIEGWVMLMRSRMTLEQPAQAQAALEAAVRANPRDEARLRGEARALGID